ncbi:MAG: hypothetical protein P8H03_07625 [Emcibacteraceae bacterium]|nr:hypothetical protein [Emcibacteraceae bacterium]MDG1859893.1 hypothetical protein [Emcibacteraceae bacterium]
MEDYPLPKEMPKVYLDDDGIINVIFGTIIVTPAHIVHGATIQSHAFRDQKMPVLIVGEIAHDIKGEIAAIGSTKCVVDVTARLAIVTEEKISKVMGEVFMKSQKNPYPTQLFSSRAEAIDWLNSF